MVNSTTNGVLWSAIDKIGVASLQFIINLILARLLIPADFGMIGMILIFVVVSQTLVDGGFGSALIQKLSPTQKDYSTIFWWNIFFSILLYLSIYILAPAIGYFFHISELTVLLRAIGVIVIVNSFSLVQKTKLRKTLSFKKIAISNITSYSGSALLAFYLAYNGFGVWSLVAMQISNSLLGVLIFWSISKWKPSWLFSFSSLKNLFSYGGYLLIANMMQDVCTHIQGVVIGRNFSAANTGLYSQSKKMDDMASMTISTIFCQVLFPVYSEYQNNINQLCELLRKNTRLISFIVFPMMMLLIIIAEPIFNMLYGAKWLEAVPYFQILCIGGFFSAIYNLNYYAVAAIGKSKSLFFWGCYKWGVLLLLLIIGASFNMTVVLFAMVLSNVNIYLTNAFLAKYYVQYNISRQIKDVAPIFLCTIITGVLIYLLISRISLHWILTSIIFAICYIAISYLFKIKAIIELRSNINIVLGKLKK